MSLETLEKLRFVIPGIIIVLLWGMVGTVTDLWGGYWPTDINELLSSIVVLVPAAIYYTTPLRSWSNQRFFADVSENLRSKMVAVAGLKDDKSIYSWTELRGIFFHFVDADASLSKKASIAYFNGLIWTSLADLRALCIAFCLPAVGLLVIGVSGAFATLAILLGLTLFSYLASRTVTERHKDIGNEQIEILTHKHVRELTRMLEAVRDRSNS